MDVELEGLEQIGSDSRGSRTPRHTTTAHSEAPPDLDDEDAAIVADQMDCEAFPDDVPNQHAGHEDEVADLFMSEEADEDAMVTALLLAGVESDVAKMYAARVVGPAKAETFYEVYGRGAIVQEAIKSRRDLNLKGLHAMDLRTKIADGTFWAFSKPQHRQDALRMQKEEKPRWKIGSLPCTVDHIELR